MKKWLTAGALSLALTAIAGIYVVFFNWGWPYTTKNWPRLILPCLIFILFATLCMRLILFGVNRTQHLHSGAKDGSHIDVTVVDGLPNIPAQTVVTLTQMPTELLISDTIHKTTARLAYSKIDNFGCYTAVDVQQKSKNVVGRAVIGGLLLGGVGALVGGMSGLGTAPNVVENSFLIFNYKNEAGEESVLSFMINPNITWGLDNFTANLHSLTGIPAPYQSIQQNGTL